MKVNTNNIRITGTYEIPSELKIDDEVTVTITAEVVKKEVKSLQNGEVDVIYILKSMMGPEEIILKRPDVVK